MDKSRKVLIKNIAKELKLLQKTLIKYAKDAKKELEDAQERDPYSYLDTLIDRSIHLGSSVDKLQDVIDDLAVASAYDTEKVMITQMNRKE